MSLAQALFAPAQAKVLARLFGEPDRWFHVNELMRATGLGSASVQREIKRLVQAGLVHTEQVGNVRRLRANPASPVYPELVGIVTKTLGIVPVLRQALAPSADRIRLALVFGSVAKGSDQAGSDIDLLVVSDQLATSDLLAPLMPAETQLGRAVHPLSCTESEFAMRLADPGSFVNKILAQPLLSIIGSVDEFVTREPGPHRQAQGRSKMRAGDGGGS